MLTVAHCCFLCQNARGCIVGIHIALEVFICSQSGQQQSLYITKLFYVDVDFKDELKKKFFEWIDWENIS